MRSLIAILVAVAFPLRRMTRFGDTWAWVVVLLHARSERTTRHERKNQNVLLGTGFFFIRVFLLSKRRCLIFACALRSDCRSLRSSSLSTNSSHWNFLTLAFSLRSICYADQIVSLCDIGDYLSQTFLQVFDGGILIIQGQYHTFNSFTDIPIEADSRLPLYLKSRSMSFRNFFVTESRSPWEVVSKVRFKAVTCFSNCTFTFCLTISPIMAFTRGVVFQWAITIKTGRRSD